MIKVVLSANRVVAKKLLEISLQAWMLMRLVIAYNSDLMRYLRWSRTLSLGRRSESPEKRRAAMLLLIHSLEKGMSLVASRQGFGAEKAIRLLALTNSYSEAFGIDYHVSLAVGTLKRFISHKHSSRPDALLSGLASIEERLGLRAGLPGGTKICRPEAIRNCYEDAFEFVRSRVSIRRFGSKNIDREVIEKAILFAQTAPSACNRQSSRVHVYDGELAIKAVLASQLGDQGWASGANKLFVVSTLITDFDGTYERSQMYIDGGMFAMQFVTGLHSLRIATCCKMYIRTPKIDKNFHRVTSIARSETPIMLVLAGHYDEQEVTVPASYRRPVSEILQWH